MEMAYMSKLFDELDMFMCMRLEADSRYYQRWPPGRLIFCVYLCICICVRHYQLRQSPFEFTQKYQQIQTHIKLNLCNQIRFLKNVSNQCRFGLNSLIWQQR